MPMHGCPRPNPCLSSWPKSATSMAVVSTGSDAFAERPISEKYKAFITDSIRYSDR